MQWKGKKKGDGWEERAQIVRDYQDSVGESNPIAIKYSINQEG